MAASIGADLASVSERSQENYWCGEDGTALDWTSGSLTAAGPSPEAGRDDSVLQNPAMVDDQVELMQMAVPSFSPAAPRARLRTPTSRNPRTATLASSMSGLASVPYMIGDTGAGTCLGFSGLFDVALAHPTLACGRLNVAEANSPLPTDRVYYSYRHFEAATPLKVYQFVEELDVDRHTLAFERTYWDGMCSFEFRLPLEHRLSSQTTSLLMPSSQDLTVGNARRTELANISVIFKSLLIERQNLAISAGLGVTLPTARGVRYDVGVGDLNGGVTATVDYGNGLTAQTVTAFYNDFSNDTVYLLPFLAWIYAPQDSRWFHQGFLQVEAAANPSSVTTFGGGAYFFSQDGVPFGSYGFATGPGPVTDAIPVRGELHPQTLLRANLGFGYHFWESAERDRYSGSARRRVTGLFETHYTTTMQDANLTDIQITSANFNTPANLQEIKLGNINNRVDLLNVATGISLTLDNTILTTGLVVPVRDCPDCGFDIEYNAQIQRRF